MHRNYVYNNITDALPGLAGAVLRGDEQGSRNGRTRELCHVGVTLSQPWQREIVLPERKANIAAQIAETMWVLSGRDDMAFLSQYLPRATDYSDDGERWRGAYGPRLRAAWGTTDGYDRQPMIDQWDHCLELLRADPLTRRAAMTIYDPAIDTEPGKDIPCNNWLVFTNRLGFLDLQVGIRSNDLLWGWSGINAFEWSALLEISAALLGVKTGCLHFSIASLHLYEQHWPKAERLTLQERATGLDDSPRFDAAACERVGGFDALADAWFLAEHAIRTGHQQADAAVEQFPEPMLRSWLRVLQWWWSGHHTYLKPLAGTRLEYATHVAMQPPTRLVQHLHRPVEQPDGTARACCEPAAVSAGESAVVAEAPGPVNPCPVCGGEVTHGHHYPGATGHPYDSPADGNTPTAAERFAAEVSALHRQKHEAYGHSWKKRGEMLGIMANIARKVDRLGGSETDDETSADTAADLMVYLFKYAAWLFDQRNGTSHSDGTEWVNARIFDTARRAQSYVADRASVEASLRSMFDDLEQRVVGQDQTRNALVDQMGTLAFLLALHLWGQQPAPEQDDYRGADVD